MVLANMFICCATTLIGAAAQPLKKLLTNIASRKFSQTRVTDHAIVIPLDQVHVYLEQLFGHQ